MQTFYEEVTASIIAELQTGAAPWTKVWDSQAGGFLPANLVTKRPYSGINVLILWSKAMSRGYPTAEWLTFKQALAAGGCVRKGEKATMVVFVKNMVIHEADKDDHSITMLKRFFVFNRSQIDGLPQNEPEILPPPTNVDAFIAATKADIRHGPFEPCYIPSEDAVLTPQRWAYHGAEHYQATVLHELVHWSGAKKRLDRDMTGRFGTQSYAVEELVAELGAAFLCAHLGVKGELRHAGYIKSWLQLLQTDAKAIFTAAARASQAANYLRSFSEQVTEETEAA